MPNARKKASKKAKKKASKKKAKKKVASKKAKKQSAPTSSRPQFHKGDVKAKSLVEARDLLSPKWSDIKADIKKLKGKKQADERTYLLLSEGTYFVQNYWFQRLPVKEWKALGVKAQDKDRKETLAHKFRSDLRKVQDAVELKSGSDTPYEKK